MKKSDKPILTDVTKTYIVPILRKGTNILEKVPCKAFHEAHRLLRFEPIKDADKYETHRFVDEHFQWLLRTKYATEKSQE